MSFFVRSTIIMFLAGLMGCSPNDKPPSSWIGRNVNEFFRTFGPPKGHEQLPSGGKEFFWENRSSWRAITGQIPMLCTAYVVTNSDEMIVEFRPGGGRLSSCAEKFGKRQK